MIHTHGKLISCSLTELHNTLTKLCAFAVPEHLRSAKDMIFAALSLPHLNYDLVNAIHLHIRDGVQELREQCKSVVADNGYHPDQSTIDALFPLLMHAIEQSTALWWDYHPADEGYRLPDGSIGWVVPTRPDGDRDGVEAAPPSPAPSSTPAPHVVQQMQKIVATQRDYKSLMKIRRPSLEFFITNT